MASSPALGLRRTEARRIPNTHPSLSLDQYAGTYTDSLVGAVATHFIPPGMPGFDQAGGLAGPQGSEFDFVQNPTGDPNLAASFDVVVYVDRAEQVRRFAGF